MPTQYGKPFRRNLAWKPNIICEDWPRCAHGRIKTSALISALRADPIQRLAITNILNPIGSREECQFEVRPTGKLRWFNLGILRYSVYQVYVLLPIIQEHGLAESATVYQDQSGAGSFNLTDDDKEYNRDS
jgi:hypothetical protein